MKKKQFYLSFICKTGNGWQNTLLADKADTSWRGWHWLTRLTLAEENNFWLRKLILLIEKIFYEVINLSYNLLFFLQSSQTTSSQTTSSQATSSQHRRKQRRRNIIVNNVVATLSQITSSQHHRKQRRRNIIANNVVVNNAQKTSL
jgi:hypothetical protein